MGPQVPARFELRQQLGQGGMGVVYRALDRETGFEVALKTLPGLSAEGIYRLKHEFRRLRDVVHPNLVRFHELFAEESWCFFTMELLEGLDFVAHARNGATSAPAGAIALIESRIRATVPSLVSALTHLHELGLIHSDVKPSNIMVETSGRLVLLDFGLVSAVDQAPDGEDMQVGTLEYMAPEQAWGLPRGPAADWYGVGATLYEALIGAPPGNGEYREVLQSKSRTHHPRDRRNEVSPQLDELVAALLQPDPMRRAGASHVLAAIGPTGSAPVPTVSTGSTEDELLGGRDQELRLLRERLPNDGSNTDIVQISGPSGIGKTALVRRFLASVSQDVLILRGRCHLQETVVFNAFDGVVDDLSRYLASEPGRTEMLPRDLPILLRLFPALGRLAPNTPDEPRDAAEITPRELRRRGGAALVDLLKNVAAKRRLVIWIDDLQWSDVDSIGLLADMVRTPQATQPRCLVLLSHRPEEPGQCPALDAWRQLRSELPRSAATDLHLGPLSPETCRLLATAWLPKADPALIERVLRESSASPYLLREICRYLRRTTAESGEVASDLAGAVTGRLEGLSEQERSILRLVAAAGGPLEQSLLQSACGGIPVRTHVNRLANDALLRLTFRGGMTSIDTYHDRIRDGLTAAWSPAERASSHGALADALIALQDPDPQRLAEHLMAAGDVDRARQPVLLAAQHATAAMAFERAARWYRLAIDIQATERPADAWRGLGQALANAGHGREAAEAFSTAATMLDGSPPEAAHTAIDLRRAAGQSYLDHGLIEEGMSVFRDLLGRIGLRLPRSRRSALLQSLWLRVRFLLRGSRFVARPAQQVPPAALIRQDVLIALVRSLSMLDHVTSDALHVRVLLDTLAVGESRRALWCLMTEACSEAAIPSQFVRQNASRILTQVEAALRTVGDPVLEGSLLASKGVVAWFNAEWREAVSLLGAARELFQTRAPGAIWEIGFCDAWWLAAATHLGNISEVAARIETIIHDAEARGDRLGLRNCLIGAPALAQLAGDDPVHVIANAERACRLISDSYAAAHYMLILTRVQAALYRGDIKGAWSQIRSAWKRFQDEQLLKLSFIRDELWHLRGRAALALAAEQQTGTRSRRALLRDVARCARQLRRHGIAVGRGWAWLLDAGAAKLANNVSKAREFIQRAVELFASCEMALWREAARHAGAAMTGDHPTIADSGSWMLAHGVKNPDLMIATLIPGGPWLPVPSVTPSPATEIDPVSPSVAV